MKSLFDLIYDEPFLTAEGYELRAGDVITCGGNTDLLILEASPEQFTYKYNREDDKRTWVDMYLKGWTKVEK